MGSVEHTAPSLSLDRPAGLVLVLNTAKGRGVFAQRSIPSGTVVEISPVLVLNHADAALTSQTSLYHYTYNWPIEEPATRSRKITQAVALGIGSIFNHSTRRQNVSWQRDLQAEMIVYRTLRDVEAGEELCINYGRLWFKDAEGKDGGTSSDEDEPDQIIARIDLVENP